MAVAVVVVVVLVVAVVSGQTEQKSNNNLLLELLPNLLTPRAAVVIVGLVRHLGSYQRYGRDRDVVACWGRSTSCIICLCPGKVNDDDESVKFAS